MGVLLTDTSGEISPATLKVYIILQYCPQLGGQNFHT